MSNQTQQVSAYFNLTADGVGYLNRPRTVQAKGKRSSEYFACTIQALHGDADEKSRFDLRIVGGEAKDLFARLLDEFPALLDADYKRRPTVFVGFRAGDITPIAFETNAKDDKGKPIKITTPSIDGRLLKFKFIKVNGEYWYKSENSHSDDAAETQTDAHADVQDTAAEEIAA